MSNKIFQIPELFQDALISKDLQQNKDLERFWNITIWPFNQN